MKRRLVCLFTVVLAVLLLVGCSDFDEMKSQRLLSQAKSLVEQGEREQAEQALTELLARYPNTQAGEVARQHIARLQQQRAAMDRQHFAKILGSFQQVFDGYQAVYGEYPRSLDALDASGYFFDAAYLDGLIPDGFQVYLLLTPGGDRYRAWCVATNQPNGYAIEAHAQGLTAVEREKTLSELQATFTLVPRGSRLVALQNPPSPN